jgi:N-acetylglucosaminyldiphosphoundecaprenol N-acetyl-beta-D-mannosaminyltransferase
MKDNLLGYKVNNENATDCINDIISWIRKGTSCRHLACLNPHSYVVSLDDENYHLALKDADWLIPDGVGVVFASRVLYGRISERVTGWDIFLGLHERLDEIGGFSVFFLGSTEDTLALISERMAKEFPKIRVAGTYSPPFKSDYTQTDLDVMISAINKVKPDVLWIGMTAPKQEKWIFNNKHQIKVKFAGAIGAVFDFYTGRIKRSHPLFQKLGLEWLPRLMQEPRRLWRRMFISAPIFVFHVLRERMNINKSH